MATNKKTSETVNSACGSAVERLSPQKAEAFAGFLQAHSLVTKALDADLIANFGLQLSELEVLMRLEGADEEGSMRISDLAREVLLSQSRVSRLVTELERQGLLERRSCETDSRVVYAAITAKGRELIREVGDRHFEGVEQYFFKGLTEAQVKQLAALWPRVIDSASGA